MIFSNNFIHIDFRGAFSVKGCRVEDFGDAATGGIIGGVIAGLILIGVIGFFCCVKCRPHLRERGGGEAMFVMAPQEGFYHHDVGENFQHSKPEEWTWNDDVVELS